MGKAAERLRSSGWLTERSVCTPPSACGKGLVRGIFPRPPPGLREPLPGPLEGAPVLGHPLEEAAPAGGVADPVGARDETVACGGDDPLRLDVAPRRVERLGESEADGRLALLGAVLLEQGGR